MFSLILIDRLITYLVTYLIIGARTLTETHVSIEKCSSHDALSSPSNKSDRKRPQADADPKGGKNMGDVGRIYVVGRIRMTGVGSPRDIQENQKHIMRLIDFSEMENSGGR